MSGWEYDYKYDLLKIVEIRDNDFDSDDDLNDAVFWS